MSIRMEVDLDALEGMLSEEGVRRARKGLAERVMQDSNLYVPVDTGSLHDSRDMEPDGSEVSWNEDYAAAVYYGDRTVSPAKSGPSYNRWFEEAAARHMEDWEKRVANVLTGGER